MGFDLEAAEEERAKEEAGEGAPGTGGEGKLEFDFKAMEKEDEERAKREEVREDCSQDKRR